nr:MAG: major capsid protein [Microviridae sp.]
MKPLFNEVKIKRVKRNAFDMSHEKKLSFNMGDLIPVYVQEILPGDKFKVNTEVLVRFAPMLAPIMHRVNVYTHYFFVPNRLVYKNWQNYITGGVDGLQTPTFPTIPYNETNRGYFYTRHLADYMGIPTINVSDPPITNVQNINALPFRAFQKIWSEYYRDQTLDTPDGCTDNDTVAAGSETSATLSDRMRCWEKDYFTSALPWTQRGGAVSIPNTLNPVSAPNITWASSPVTEAINSYPTISGTTTGIFTNNGGVATRLNTGNQVDISLINLRRAARLQEWLEKNATGGSRYIEQMLAHFDVKSSDARLQRPEYLGGGKSPVVISEIVSMVKETSNPQGTMAGHGISVGNHMGFNRYFEEHGYVIGIMSVIPRTAYQQGLPRMYSKVDRYDWFWPEFANIGEQAILNKEIYHDPFEATDRNDGVFGYTPRYAEYRFNNSTVHGDFRTTLNFWHLGRIFSSRPSLNNVFVQASPTSREFAVEDGHHLWVQLYNKVKAIRPIPVFGTPTL